jgi:hypothetical protein
MTFSQLSDIMIIGHWFEASIREETRELNESTAF